MQDMNKKQTVYQRLLEELSFKLEKKQITEKLKNKSVDYFEYTW
jgi:hypothetical protein